VKPIFMTARRRPDLPWRRWLLGSAWLLAGWQHPLLAETIEVPMRAISAGTFYVQAEIGGMGAVDFLVDTGSGYTVIDTRMLDTLSGSGGVSFLKNLEGTMADGSRKVVPVYRVSQLRLGSCALQNVDVAVFEAGARPILGMHALRRMSPFTFSVDPPAIRLGSCDVTGADMAIAESGSGEVASFESGDTSAGVAASDR
jgi:predicted aspartyl protease